MNRISLFSSPFRGWSSNILARLLLAPNPSSDELRQCLAMLTTRLGQRKIECSLGRATYKSTNVIALGSGDGHTSIEASLDTPHDIWLIAESRVLAKVHDSVFTYCEAARELGHAQPEVVSVIVDVVVFKRQSLRGFAEGVCMLAVKTEDHSPPGFETESSKLAEGSQSFIRRGGRIVLCNVFGGVGIGPFDIGPSEYP
ncbi:hypothetical protein KCU92_g197, partial [Aureobasidium melanogenum]